MQINKIYQGDCLEVLKTFPDCSIDCCVTSPPYFGLRDYGHQGQIGLEETPELFVVKMVEVFTEVKRVIKNEGSLWLNLGDSYSGSGKGGQSEEKRSDNWHPVYGNKGKTYGLKPKDLIGIPWMVAFALRSTGWYLRQDIIWAKPNPMPESVTDRCTKSHEYVFLMSKSAKYHYDHEAIRLENAESTILQHSGKKPSTYNDSRVSLGMHGQGKTTQLGKNGEARNLDGANKRSVWTVTTKPFKESHFATFPEDLIVDMIKAGCPENGIVLDPFSGAGTTALVARKLQRNYIGIELNPAYIEISEKRLRNQLGMFQ